MILKCVVNNIVFRVLSKYIFNERFHFVLILFFSFLGSIVYGAVVWRCINRNILCSKEIRRI